MKKAFPLLVVGLLAALAASCVPGPAAECYNASYDWEENLEACDRQVVEEYIVLAETQWDETPASGRKEANPIAGIALLGAVVLFIVGAACNGYD
jgi:hypothetical protein